MQRGFLDLDTVSSAEVGDMNITEALQAENPSIRLRAALAAGTDPDPTHLEVLVHSSGVEPDFFVRDMLTWALTRHSSASTFPLLAAAVADPEPQVRSQALHTLTKIHHPGIWELIDPPMLHDASPAVRTTAWRLAVTVVPEELRGWLARELIRELGRGDDATRRSLSRALVALEDESTTLLEVVGAHVREAFALLLDPESDSVEHVAAARKVAALGLEQQN